MMSSSKGGTSFLAKSPGPLSIFANLASLIRLSNQSGTLLLMLPSLWALVLASGGTPPLHLLLIFVVGAFLMRSAGVIINDLADRSLDRQVERTKNRPLASGALQPSQALFAASTLLLCAASLLFFLNPLAALLSPVALILAILYPFTKRFFHIPQFFLGLAFGWGAVMAWAATRNQLDLPVWFLFGATICWALAYDTIYALQDRQDDIRVGVKSSATLFGSLVWLAVGLALIGMTVLLGIAGWWEGVNLTYYGVLGGVAGFLSQQVWRLRREVSPSEAFSMFKQHIGVGWVILGGIWLGFL